MNPCSQQPEEIDLSAIPNLQNSAEPLWLTNYYNGVAEGVCEVSSEAGAQLAWFEWDRDRGGDNGDCRVYLVYALTPEQAEELRREQERFEQQFGNYNRLDLERGQVVRHAPAPAGYYQHKNPDPERYLSNEILGYFDEDAI